MGFYLKNLCESWPCDLLMVKGLKKIENPLKPELLAVLEHLNSRKSLPEIETLNYERQSQGYIGLHGDDTVGPPTDDQLEGEEEGAGRAIADEDEDHVRVIVFSVCSRSRSN